MGKNGGERWAASREAARWPESQAARRPGGQEPGSFLAVPPDGLGQSARALDSRDGANLVLMARTCACVWCLPAASRRRLRHQKVSVSPPKGSPNALLDFPGLAVLVIVKVLTTFAASHALQAWVHSSLPLSQNPPQLISLSLSLSYAAMQAPCFVG